MYGKGVWQTIFPAKLAPRNSVKQDVQEEVGNAFGYDTLANILYFMI